MKNLAVLLVVFMALYLNACEKKDNDEGDDIPPDVEVKITPETVDDVEKEVHGDVITEDVEGKYDIPPDLPTDIPTNGEDFYVPNQDVPNQDIPPVDIPAEEEVTPEGLSCKEFFFCANECPQGPAGDVCVNECMAQMTSEAGMQFNALRSCLENNGCYGKPTDEEFFACLEEFCIHEYFKCFSGDTYQTCIDLNNCLNACPEDNPDTPDVEEDNECFGNCFLEATYQANIDFENMRKCFLAECPPPDKWTNECLNNAIAGPCNEEAEKCLPQGTLKCGEILTCLANCPPADQQCAQDCVSSGTFEAQNLFFEIIDCLQKACPPPNDTEECLMQAEQNQCKPKIDACVQHQA